MKSSIYWNVKVLDSKLGGKKGEGEGLSTANRNCLVIP
jgi:hypothetical protein